MTREEFDKKLEELGIKTEIVDIPGNLATLKPSQSKFQFYFMRGDDKYVFEASFNQAAIDDLQSLFSLDASTEMRSAAIELLNQELKILLLRDNKVEEFIKIYGLEHLKEIVKNRPQIAKWLAEP